MIAILAKSIRENKKNAILTPIFVVLEVVMEVLIPIMMSSLLDRGIEVGNMKYVWAMGLGLLIASFMSLAFGVLAGNTASKASCGFARNLRKDMYENVQNFSFSNIDKFSTASIITRLTTDVNNVQMAFQMLIRMAFRAPLTFIFAIIASLQVNAKLTLIFLAVAPVLIGGLFLIIFKVRPIFERMFKNYDKLNNVVQENLRGVRVVKSYVREDFETDKFETVSKSIYTDSTKAERLLAFNGPLMQFCMYTCMLLIAWFAAAMIVESGNVPELGMTTGKLSGFMQYIMMILMSLMMLSMLFVMFSMSRASMERVTELLVEKSDIVDGASGVDEVKNGEIVFEHVSFGYAGKGRAYCLYDIDLTIHSGETVGIIGGTGSSKSSLVQLIPRLYDVTEGVVKVGGRDVREYKLDALRNEVAMVLQKNELFSGTIKENLRWGNEYATDEELVRVCRLAQADEFVQAFPEKYDTYIEQGGTNVSGGQKQRLCIARALLKKPKILILDDSTSAVDTRTDALIRQAFRDEIPNTTKVILLIRLIYRDKIMGEGLHAPVTSLEEIRRYGKETNLIDEKLPIKEWEKIFYILSKHQMIEVPGAIQNIEDKTKIYLYSTINMYCSGASIQTLLSEYKGEGGSVDEEDIYANGTE